MSLEDLSTAFGHAVDRRRFLKKLSIVGFGSALVALGLPARASAYNYACCTLCDSPVQPYSCGGDCTWCWTCGCWGGHKWSCCENYALGQGCAGGCPSYCSWATVLSDC